MTTRTTDTSPGGRGPAARLVRHYVEMVLSMALGMVLVYPVLAAGFGTPSQGSGAETDALLMATAMALPMAAWMSFRGHQTQHVVEMCGSMYAGFLVLFPFLWAGALSHDALLVGGHVLMLLFMLVAMLCRAAAHRHVDPEG